MELQVSRQPVATNEVLWNATVEQPVECDVLLPDYCPDIVRILRCVAEPAASQAVVSGNQLTIDGMVTIHIYYKSQERQLCHTLYKMPFHKLVELKNTAANPMVQVQAQAGYFNCRPVNQRRLDLRGTVELQIKVLVSDQIPVVSQASGQGVCCRIQTVPGVRMVAWQSRPFTVREELELESGKEAVAAPVQTFLQASLTDYKVISGKLIAKGELAVTLLYLCDGQQDQYDTTTHTIPISQIVDVEQLEEDCICSASLLVSGCDVQPKADLDGVAHMISLEATLELQVMVCKQEEYQVATDCYGTQFETTCQSKPVSVCRCLVPVEESIGFHETLDLPEDVVSICHLWTEIAESKTTCENQKLILSGKLRVCMFGQYASGELEYFDRMVDFSQSLSQELNCEGCHWNLCYQIRQCRYQVNGQIDLQGTIGVTGMVFCPVREQLLTEIAIQENKPVKGDSGSCLTVYFAQDGESVWEIAKRYRAFPAMVMEENNLEEDTLTQRQMLLIPIM